MRYQITEFDQYGNETAKSAFSRKQDMEFFMRGSDVTSEAAQVAIWDADEQKLISIFVNRVSTPRHSIAKYFDIAIREAGITPIVSA